MNRIPARFATLLLTITYGLIAVVGSGGMHFLAGISHSVHVGHDHAICGGHVSNGSDRNESDCPKSIQSVSEGRSAAQSHHCPICRWFAQCKSPSLTLDSEVPGVFHVERLCISRQSFSYRPLYRQSRPRGPPTKTSV